MSYTSIAESFFAGGMNSAFVAMGAIYVTVQLMALLLNIVVTVRDVIKAALSPAVPSKKTEPAPPIVHSEMRTH